ncbi:MAG: LacI family transcriptional regulator [Caloramator sp.]|nr:LacI family transcriptional regulator [Caloramator sp.]
MLYREVKMGLNIKDIAKLAGVSPATVSRVINETGNVAEEKKQRVLKVLKETGYKPNALARGLLLNKTNVIGVIVPDLSNINFAEFVKGIENEAKLNGLGVLLTTSENDTDSEISYFQLFKEKRVDGIIFSGTIFTEKHREELEKADIPFIVFGQWFEHYKLICVNIDNEKAAYEATKYLISKGAKNLSMIMGPLWDRSAGYDRYSGFLKAVVEGGISPKDVVLEEGDFTIKSGYRAMKRILEKKNVDGVLAANDFMALGAIKYLVDMGMMIPDEVQIMGFDDNMISEIYNPSLSTVKINFYEAGRICVKAFVDRINNKPIENNILLPYELVIRGSTK